MVANRRPFRVVTRKSVLSFHSQAALGRWLFDRAIDPARLCEPDEQADLRIELPSGRIAQPRFLVECIHAYRNESLLRASHHGYCPVRRYRSYRWDNVSERLRHVRTMQEKRLHSLVLREEGEPAIRPARRPRALPDLFDDIWRHNEKNWKRYRRVQWKTRKNCAN